MGMMRKGGRETGMDGDWGSESIDNRRSIGLAPWMSTVRGVEGRWMVLHLLHWAFYPNNRHHFICWNAWEM